MINLADYGNSDLVFLLISLPGWSYVEDAYHGGVDILDKIGSEVKSELTDLWDGLVVPALEDVLALIGITDEDIVLSQRVSSLLFEDNIEDVVQKAATRAVLSMNERGGTFFGWYMHETRLTQNQIRGFFQYVDRGRHTNGLPTIKIQGGKFEYTEIDNALNDYLGGFGGTRKDSSMGLPNHDVYFMHEYQSAPYNYIPWANTLTHVDPNGVSRDDYKFDSATYVPGAPDTYDIAIHRIAKEALFWIEGPDSVIEGDPIVYRVWCNRNITPNKPVYINLAYTGSAPGADYTAVAQVIMLPFFKYVEFTVETTENVASDGFRDVICTIDSITDSNLSFEVVGIHAQNSITTTIKDDEGIILTMASHTVTFPTANAVIPVKLEGATAGAFTVDYVLNNGTAEGGLDFTNSPVQLNFAGTTGEIQNITVPISVYAADNDEYFIVALSACSDPAVDISQTSRVTIYDENMVDFSVASTVTVSDVIVEPAYTREHSLTVKYYVNTDAVPNYNSAHWFYWVYKFDSGTYPLITPVMNIVTKEMLPVVSLRNDRVFVNADKDTDEYKSSNKLLKILGLDLNDIISNITENLSTLDDVYINFAVSPSTSKEIVSKYLWNHFYDIIVTSGLVRDPDPEPIGLSGKSTENNVYTSNFQQGDINSSVVWKTHSYNKIQKVHIKAKI